MTNTKFESIKSLYRLFYICKRNDNQAGAKAVRLRIRELEAK